MIKYKIKVQLAWNKNMIGVSKCLIIMHTLYILMYKQEQNQMDLECSEWDNVRMLLRFKIMKLWLTHRSTGTSLKLGCLASCTSCNKTPSVVVRNASLCFSRDSAKRRSVWLKMTDRYVENPENHWLIGHSRLHTTTSTNKHISVSKHSQIPPVSIGL